MTLNAFGGKGLEDHALYVRAAQFYGYEAKLLDDGRFREWLDLLDDAIEYLMPVRASAGERDAEIQKDAFRIRDTKKMIRTRIERLETGIAASEVPPSRLVRSVSSVALLEDSEPGVVGASTAVIMYRSRGIDERYDIIPVRRNDRLRVGADGLRLLSRTIVSGEAVLHTPNLGFFI